LASLYDANPFWARNAFVRLNSSKTTPDASGVTGIAVGWEGGETAGAVVGVDVG
jgi:hypothetical protein